MSQTQKKQFAIWLDTQHAIIAGRADNEGELTILGHEDSEVGLPNTSEHAGNNRDRTATTKFFKAIAHHMQNAEEVLVAGPGTAQEQFIHYLAETPQFKNVKATDKTTERLDGESLLQLAEKHFS